MKASELKRILLLHGCYLYRQGGRHEIWKSKITGLAFTVPRHGSQEIPIGTLKSIKKSAGI